MTELREPDKFLSWLRQIMANECKMFLRKRKEVTSLDAMADRQDTEAGHPYPQDISVRGRTRMPAENAINAECREMLLSAMMTLPADDRLVLTLQYM